MRILTNGDAMPRPPRLGETWELHGSIVRHPEHGPQLQASSAILERPTGEMVISFLCSPACPGIGKVRARQLYEAFGDRLYDLLDGGDPHSLNPIVSAELARAAMLAWAEQTLEAGTYRWLDAHGLPRKIAAPLAAIYGNALPEKAKENPYRLLAFLPWRQVEALARAIGVPLDDPRRLVAGVEAAVYARLEGGHTATEKAELLVGIRSLLDSSEESAATALRLAIEDNAVLPCGGLIVGAGAAAMETFLANQVVTRLGGQGQMPFTSALGTSEIARELDRFEQRLGYSMNQEQRAAVAAAVRMPLSLLTGGAGTGKTTALRAVHDICERQLSSVYQIALAGRAAQRMKETTGRPAMTIAGFINRIADGTIELDALSGALVIIDEASMLDLPLFYRLLKKLPPDTRLMLVGDPGQIPPIGFGLVLHVLAEPESPIPKTHLLQVHRQADSTGIPAVARSIRVGELPAFVGYAGPNPGVSFIECADQEIPDRLVQLRAELGATGTQIISALRTGNAGVAGINNLFHSFAEDHGREPGQFLAGEPVIWVRNDYDLELMNGSLGTVVAVGADELRVDFDGETRVISGGAIGNLEHAYAITVHKAQGSQFPRVIMPVTRSRLLDRTMLYTAATRAQQQVVLVGDRKAFESAVRAEGISASRQIGLRYILGHRLNRPVAVATGCGG
ncbi:Exodeoxyribonuclease V alpha chain [Hyphomicrobiales bacterium]|jgi:exodeoxyribonuclease V alpha subunit|nr:Exodeoxyribonuclease V alpha chain [Hyphomicrobiales bacterium]CAH1688429.1 Exodeoxyribonuclease V alpha chain [Hyphomicrobiales bacterium]CAH1701680.1 Exodeoxyribonuclease V alpha chain [Hyphomicrobiales bacterium]CAI0347205.1 exodeoxyribonuclease V alpha subunit [Hyphomicrobiales bacterium]